jgi:hypothetical protein
MTLLPEGCPPHLYWYSSTPPRLAGLGHASEVQAHGVSASAPPDAAPSDSPPFVLQEGYSDFCLARMPHVSTYEIFKIY